MISLKTLSNSYYETLKEQYFQVVAKNMMLTLTASEDEIIRFVSQQLTPVIEEARISVNDYFCEIVLQDSQKTIGSLWYRLHPDTYFSDMALIVWIGVEEAHRKQGFAKEALTELSSQLISRNIRRLTLEVFDSNEPAYGLYKSLGFKAERTVMGRSLV